MVISGVFFLVRRQWGHTTFTFDVNCGRSPTLAEGSLNMAIDTHVAVGIRSFLTRNTPVSDEEMVDFGPFYWVWPGKVFNQTMTQVTFAVDTSESQLSGHFQVTFFE